jgi:Zn-finger nucleic acid-binding protein
MNCPRCNKPTLEEKNRDSITIDVCQLCRGIWLDRGELERLIAKAELEPESGPREYNQHHGHQDHHRDHCHGDKRGYEGEHHRKKSWLSEIFD